MAGHDSNNPRLARLVPAVGWLPRYERRWLRGDLTAGAAVTALVVPKNLGYAGIAGVPLQNGLYAAAAGAIIYALLATSRQISTGPSSSLAAVAGAAVLTTGLERRPGRAAGCRHRARDRPAVHPARRLPAGMDRAVPLQGRDHGLPGGRRGRRGRRRAAQAHGNVGGGRQRLARVRDVAAIARRRGLDDGARRGGVPRGDPRPALPGARRPRRAGARRRRPGRLGALRPWRTRRRARRRRAARAAGPRAARLLPGRGPLRDDRRRGGGAAVDRLLPDGRRRPGVRGASSLSDRRQPGVRGPGDGERGRRGVPGDAGVDQPVGQLAQRVGGRTHAGLLAGERRAGDRDAARPRPAVLAPAEGRARRRSSSTRSCSG